MGRDDYKAIIESFGGVVKGISKTTDYLVTSDMKSTSGKMKKAIEYNIQVISYEDLERILNI
jgi:DNA ligase (NAD+)